MTVEPAQLANAILCSVVDGSYPDSEDVAGAELAAGALPEIVRYLQKAREDVQASSLPLPFVRLILRLELTVNEQEDIRKVSRVNAPELDSWMKQARRLHADIAASHTKADEILQLAGAEEALEQECEDAMTQARLLVEEIRFNDELAAVLGRLQLIGGTLAHVERAMGSDLGEAVTMLAGAEDALEKMGGGPTIMVALMREQAAELRKALRDKVDGGWGGLIDIDKQKGSIKIRKDITGTYGTYYSLIPGTTELMGHEQETQAAFWETV